MKHQKCTENISILRENYSLSTPVFAAIIEIESEKYTHSHYTSRYY